MKKLLYLFILLPVLLTACWKEEEYPEMRNDPYPLEIEAKGITLTQDSIGKYSFQWTKDTISFTLKAKSGGLKLESVCYNGEPPEYNWKGVFNNHGLSIIEDKIIPGQLNCKLASQSKGSFRIHLFTGDLGYAYLTIKP